jgi:hypothetical protein
MGPAKTFREKKAKSLKKRMIKTKIFNLVQVSRSTNYLVFSGVIPAVTTPMGKSWNSMFFDLWITAFAGMTAFIFFQRFRKIPTELKFI